MATFIRLTEQRDRRRARVDAGADPLPMYMAAGEQKQKQKGGGGDDESGDSGGGQKLAEKGEELKE